VADGNRVYAGLCAGKYATLIEHKLYLPKGWTNDKEMRKRTDTYGKDCFLDQPPIGSWDN